ncbi:MAG TPA: hypothetical protein VNA13_02460, partial [Xanthomonadales bacterium]|nr:hypothetical protein [Xanthomonadales bacterium]
ILIGSVMLIFHNWMGEYSTRFREKVMNIVYDERVRRGNKRGFLILGIFFIIIGIFMLLK